MSKQRLIRLISTRNKFETRIHRELSLAKVKVGYETERLPYILARYYIPDFVIELNDKKIYIETKGYLRPEDKSKMKAVKKAFPDIDLRIVFYEKKLKYIKWAEKNGLIWAIGSVPEEWYLE